MSMTPAIAILQMHLPDRLSRWAQELAAAELLTGLDAHLIAAIMDRESNGKPEVVGADGHGRGIMQIDDRYHLSFCQAVRFDGRHLWKIPAYNVLYGAQLLAANLQSSQDLIIAIGAYNCGLSKARGAVIKLGPGQHSEEERTKAVDACTTSSNYVTDVLARYHSYLHSA